MGWRGRQRTYPCSDFNTTDFLARVLDAEQPDLVIFTGDNLAGVMPDPELSIRQYSQVVVDRQIPWVRGRARAVVVAHRAETANRHHPRRTWGALEAG